MYTMGVFRQAANAITRFMYGRNGVDALNRALLLVYVLVCLVRTVVAAGLRSRVGAAICDVALWVLMLLIFFRMFSKNLYKRREENQKWVNWWWGVKNRSAGARARHADKEHRYFTCKQCKTICRVPVGKGKIIITCPKCGAQIHGKT